MSCLEIWDQGKPPALQRRIEDPGCIAQTLASFGVHFGRWAPREGDDPLVAYASELEELRRLGGYTTLDVVSLTPEHPKRAELRQTFLREHTHVEDEVRFFAAGEGLFFLRLEGEVHRLLCTAGDVISVPAGTPHWFDTGAAPSFTAVRVFKDPSGWVADYTDTRLEEHYPLMAP